MNVTPLKNVLMILLILAGIFLINIELTAVNLALAQIAHDFSVPISKTSSMLSLYLAFFAVFTVVGGKLGDLWGRKNIALFMLFLFICASAMGGLAKLYSVLLVSRCLQGLSAGAILPNYTALLYDKSPIEKKSRMISLISMVVGSATSAGPLIGSFICHFYSWRYIFLLNIPVGGLILIGFFIFIEDSSKRAIGLILDYKGMILTIFLILLLMRFINIIPTIKPVEIFYYSIILLSLLFFWLIVHLNAVKPFLTLKLFHKRSFALGCTIRLFLGFNYYIILYVLGLFSQEVLHFKSFWTGVMYLPMTLAVTLSSMIYAKLRGVINLITLLRLSLAVFAVGAFIFSYSLHSVIIILFLLLLLGVAYGLLYTSLFSLTLHDVASNNTSEASGMLYFCNLLGGTIGVSVAGVQFNLLSSHALSHLIFYAVHNLLIVSGLLLLLCLVIALVALNKGLVKIVTN